MSGLESLSRTPSAEPASTTTPSNPARARAGSPRRRLLYAAIAVVIAVVAIVAALATVPVVRGFSFQITFSTFAPGDAMETYPSGAHVHFTWYTDDGSNASFFLFDSNGKPVYQSEGFSGGTYNFTATSGAYTYEASNPFTDVAFTNEPSAEPSGVVTVFGQSSAPILIL